MGDNTLSVIARNAHSDYGSEIDAPSISALSDYGSDVDVDDIDDATLVDSVIEPRAAAELKTVIYPSIEVQDTLAGVDEAVVVHSPKRRALPWAHGSPARRAFSGIGPPEMFFSDTLRLTY